jgi:hypothetical protein
MHHTRHCLFILGVTAMVCLLSVGFANGQTAGLSWMKSSQEQLEAQLVQKYGEGQRTRLHRGLLQAADFWRAEDGGPEQFAEFVRANFAGDDATLDAMFSRYEDLMEKLGGHMLEIKLAFREQADLDRGAMLPVDDVFSAYEPAAHINDDFFQNKLAFAVLLNFPLTTLEERMAQAEKWTRRQWAEARLAQRFSKRIPADVSLALSQAESEAASYIASYNIWMHHVLDQDGRRIFPPGLRLLSHWNLRDEIKADYSEPGAGGIAKQRLIQKVMERIVTQTIPAVVIDNPNVDWNPYTNRVTAAAVKDADVPERAGMQVTDAPEPDTRYAVLQKTYAASRKVDPFSPTAPTLIDRKFNEERELPEGRVKGMLEAVLSSPLAARVAAVIERRLGRPLEPFDIWYNGFRPRGTFTEAQLDSIVSKKYPTADAYKQDIPNLLVKLGFTPERAQYLTDHIVVDPARGSGHAWGAGMRSSKAHLRTRVEKTGMNYKGYNIAVHEMGHNVEQVFSLNEIDHIFLQGVPNTAFTEALAFVFQGHDLELLGLAAPDRKSETMKVLNNYWEVFEISGVALVDMEVWHWMYDHPAASPAELKDAVVGISKGIWNKFYAPIFKKKDVLLLGIYSHMIDSFMYLPDYPLGHLIAFQIEEHVKKAGSLGAEFERMAKTGSISPDLWMKNATGSPVGPEALLEATQRALKNE